MLLPPLKSERFTDDTTAMRYRGITATRVSIPALLPHIRLRFPHNYDSFLPFLRCL